MRFGFPWVLILLSLLPLAALLGWWLYRLGMRRLENLVAPELQETILPRRTGPRLPAQVVLTLAGLALLLFAAARPQWGQRDDTIVTRGRNVIVALDVSRSMLARDVHPNRLERAKVDIMDLLGELEGDRVGLLAFRGKANMICPLTTDRAFLRQALDGMSPESAPRGSTDLADAIRTSLTAFEDAAYENNAIMLITDGEDLEGRAAVAAQEAGRRGVPIFAVGIGDPAGAGIPDSDGDGMLEYEGQQVVSRLMESTLEEVARASGGAYIPLATSGTASTTLGAIYRRHLRRVAAREQEERLQSGYRERFGLFLTPAILLLAAVGMLSCGRLARPRRSNPPGPRPATARVLLFLGFLCLSFPVRAQEPSAAVSNSAPAVAAAAEEPVSDLPTGRAGARVAQRLYRRGNHLEAAEAYLAAASGSEPAAAARYRFNAALALLEAGEVRQAADILRPLSAQPDQEAAAELYAAVQLQLAQDDLSTNELARAEALEQAAAQFQRVLRQAPAEERRGRNLARAVKPLGAAREAAHVARVLEKHADAPPDQLLDRMLREQRALIERAPSAFTNPPAARIAALESLGDRQADNADLWIPLKQQLLASGVVTNERQRAFLAQNIETLRDAMKSAARGLRDLEERSLDDVSRSEQGVYALWKGLAAPPALLDEDLAAQTNALARPERPRYPNRPDQLEATELTGLFRERFPPWADRLQAQAQSDTNAPTLTPEARQEIEFLAGETQELQRQSLDEPNPDDARRMRRQALDNLHRIRELLPKSPQSPPPQSPPEQEQDPQPQPQPQESPSPREQNQEQPSEKPEPSDEPPPEIKDVLQRALQREKEHEAEKRRRMREFPLPPNARDW